ncbi:MAG TPA: HD domain-containing protein [Bacteroidales bacterium]|nr:HD domain-containing protein [Bacteroidales bacterium]
MFFTPSDFDIKPGYFVHESELHGASHTYRVMCHVLVLSNRLKLLHAGRLAFCAAFVHDMARRHDGFCLMHGPRAARDKVPEFIPLFHKYNLETEDINTIKTAVSNHSQYVELRKNHPHYLVTSLLKDADALDRIRLGDGNLNPKYLRHKASLELKDFSRNLYLKSERIPVSNFETMLDMAQELYGSELMGL